MVEVLALDAYNQEDTGDVSKTIAARNDQDAASLVVGALVARSGRNGGMSNADVNAGHLIANSLRGEGFGATTMAVRRMTPTECARLQGFPDNHLDILYRGKPAADGPKYKALGNSWAVPVVRWIGKRIQEVA